MPHLLGSDESTRLDYAAMRSHPRRPLPFLVLAGASLLTLFATTCQNGETAITDGGAEGVSVAITSPEDGSSTKGNVVTLSLEANDIEIISADGDTSGETGHFHIFVDQVPVGPGEVIPEGDAVIHTTETEVVIAGLRPGLHTFVVVLGDGTHTRIGSFADEVSVSVEGPSVTATAPAEISSGEVLQIQAQVEGIEIVAADGDTSGETGHLHVLVDPPSPPALGTPIPADGAIHTTSLTIQVPDLTTGEHTLWVVVGDGTHAPLDPLVAAIVKVTVV